jgi:SAM-dependent methyltransferase
MLGWTDSLTLLQEREAGANHSIDRYSRHVAAAALARYLPSAGSVLELGSSSGYMLERIRSDFPRVQLTGSDVIPSIVERLVKKTDVPVRLLDITANDWPSASLDAVVALNVFEHIENDAMAASEVFRILKRGGAFIIEVPAGPNVFNWYDATLFHFRRYTRRTLRDLLTGAGFRIVEQSAIGFLAYPGFWVAKKLSRLRHGLEPNEHLLERAIQSSRDNRLLGVTFDLERQLQKVVSLPFGIRHTAVAIRPPN